MFKAFFAHGSNTLLAAALVGMVFAFAAGSMTFSWTAAAIGALVFFTSEYTTHRYLLHAPAAPWPWLRKLQHRLHYDHHIDPPKLELLFLPWWFAVPVVLLYYGIYFAITRSTPISLSITFGSLLGLAYYEWVHYVAHTPFNPITPFGRYVKKYHLWHHFKNERLWFGVTNPSMDLVMRTYRPVAEVDRSGTTREIWKAEGP